MLTTIIDTLARLSVYTVPSPEVSYMSLLPHFLPPRTSLPHTLVMIALDWTHPWTFVEELETWLQWIESWAKGDGSRELEIVREECRERRELVSMDFTPHSINIFRAALQYKHIYNITQNHHPTQFPRHRRCPALLYSL